MSDSQSSPSIRAPRPGGTNLEATGKRNRLRLWLLIVAALIVLIALAAVASAPYWKPILRPYLPWIASSTEDTGTPNPAANPSTSDSSDNAAPSSNSASQPMNGQPSSAATASEKKPEADQPPVPAPQRPTSGTDASATTLQTLGDDQRKLAVTIGEVAGRLDKLEAAMQHMGDQAHTDRVLILAAAQLQDALSRSAPYEPPLAVLQALAGSDQQLAPMLNTLAPNAHTGVKSRAVLAQELRLLEPVLAEPLTETHTSWWQEAVERAKRLISVRHVADPAHPETSPPGPDRTLALAEVDLLKDDLGGAIQEMSSLEGDAAERAKHWLNHAQARLDAEQAAAKIETVLTQRLASPEEAVH